MGVFLSEEVSERIGNAMFKNFSNSESEEFLKKELERYKPQFTGWEEKDILEFIEYQRRVWLERVVPEIGTPITSLNPTFVDGVEGIQTSAEGLTIYTRASIKENGYRFQLHNAPKKATAFTRQFTPYDLRMFPEFKDLFSQLPVMIGDTELINAKYPHLAGFNRVNARIPNTKYWPLKGTTTIDEAVLKEYLKSEMFEKGLPTEEFKMTLAFHGLFAISDPDTWNKPRKKQLESLESVCSIPMNYRRVDELLDVLRDFSEQKGLNARIVERKIASSEKELQDYVAQNAAKGLEGTVIVQYAEDQEGKPSLALGKSIKIKTYETVDAVLLGVYLHKKEDGLKQENLKGALLGLYDKTLNCYLPVCKVNLDSEGVQIKTDGQRERLTNLRQGLVEAISTKQEATELTTLEDVFVEYSKRKLSCTFEETEISRLFKDLPRGENLLSLLELYKDNKKAYEQGLGNKKSDTKKDKWVQENKELLAKLLGLNKKNYAEITGFLSQYSEVKTVSKKLVKPQFLVDTTEPVIVEAQVFDMKWKLNQYCAGFKPEQMYSFQFNNCFAERVRNDKSTTTDYETIAKIAEMNTVADN